AVTATRAAAPPAPPGCRPPFAGTSRMLMRPHHRGIHGHDPLDGLPAITDLGMGQDLVPRPISGPPPQPLMTGLPRAITLGQIPPRSTRAQLPQDPVDHLPVIPPPPAAPPRRRQQRLDHRPRPIGQLTTPRHA